MKTKLKQGISLIVLVITIIIMIILATGVIISLTNSEIINKATQAVQITDAAQVQDLASVVWAEAYLDDYRGEDLAEEVKEKLEKQGVSSANWSVLVTNTGVRAINKKVGAPLSSLINKNNYGDTVDYSVTIDGTTYSDWQIYYHNKDYVYLIAKDKVESIKIEELPLVEDLTDEELALYEIFRVGDGPKFTLVDEIDGSTLYNCKAVTQLIKNYSKFANTEEYEDNVVGALGGPTIELLVAAWNAKGNTPKLSVSLSTKGYYINGGENLEVDNDGFYIPEDYRYWLASPSGAGVNSMLIAGKEYIEYYSYYYEYGIRPVVCLKADTPAYPEEGTYNFCLVK